jgi:hypothetical protein
MESVSIVDDGGNDVAVEMVENPTMTSGVHRGEEEVLTSLIFRSSCLFFFLLLSL